MISRKLNNVFENRKMFNSLKIMGKLKKKKSFNIWKYYRKTTDERTSRQVQMRFRKLQEEMAINISKRYHWIVFEAEKTSHV